jgi:hypothetical protein
MSFLYKSGTKPSRIGEAAFAAAIGIVAIGFIAADKAATSTTPPAAVTATTTIAEQIEQAQMTISAAAFGEMNFCEASPEKLAKFYAGLKNSSFVQSKIPQAIIDPAVEKFAADNVTACAEIATRHAPALHTIAEWSHINLIYNGTAVVVTMRFQNMVCVLPANQMTPGRPCIWVMDSELHE